MSDNIRWQRNGATIKVNCKNWKKPGSWSVVIPRKWTVEYYYHQTFFEWLKLLPRKLVFFLYYKINKIKTMRLK